MRAIRGRDTKPERELRAALFARGLRYRKDLAPLAGLRCRADIVFTRHRVAVFVDGCFWHGCPEHWSLADRNRPFWRTKVEVNRSRDRRNDQALAQAGWRVVRVWEHEDPRAAAARIETLVRHSA
jgi:DNA mismatch endonuclease (patch repair protein)